MRAPWVAFLVLCAVGCRSGGEEISEESPGLAARATVDAATARKTALASIPGGRITAGELEEESGRLVYSFDVAVEGSSGVEEVWVDATTGRVVSVEHESAAGESAEADESSDDEADEEAEAREGAQGAVLSEESPGLRARAAITDAAARSAALARVPGGTIVQAELEEEDGVLIYSYDVRVEGRGGVTEVHVDAGTGRVLSVEHESGESG